MIDYDKDFEDARGRYINTKRVVRDKDTDFEMNNPIPDDAGDDFYTDWADRSVDFSFDEYKDFEYAEDAFLDAVQNCLKNRHPEKWKQIKGLFLDKVNRVGVKDQILELALRMKI